MDLARPAETLLTVLTALFFVVMWTLLVKQNVRSAKTEGFPLSYEEMLSPGQERRESVLGIYFGDERLGTTSTVIKRSQTGEIEVDSQTHLDIGHTLPFMPGKGKVDISFSARISPLSGLMSVQVHSKALNASVLGLRRAQSITLRGHVGNQTVQTRVPYERNAFVGHVFGPLGKLTAIDESMLGNTWTVQIVNPLRASLEQVEVTVADSDTVTWDGQRREIFALDFETPTARWRSWVLDDGEILIQGTPFGISLRREDVPSQVIDQLLSPPPPD